MAATTTPDAASNAADAAPPALLPEVNGSVAPTQGTVTFVTGEATVLRLDESGESLGDGIAVGSGDVLGTGNGAVVGMNFAGHTGLAMGENSILVVEGPAEDSASPNVAGWLSLPEGKIVFASAANHADGVLIETPGGSLNIGQARGCVRTLPDGHVELVLFPGSDENTGELLVTNAAGRFVIGTPYVVFTFDYMTPPAANELVPLDEVLGEFSAPLAALAAVVSQPLDQIIGDLVLEDRQALTDDSGLQLAGSEAIVVEPARTLAVTSFNAPIPEYVQEYPRPAIQFSSLPESNRSSGLAFARLPSSNEDFGQNSAFSLARVPSGGDEGLSVPRVADGSPAPAFGPDALAGSSSGVTNGSSGEVQPGATNGVSGGAIPGITNGLSGEALLGGTDGSPGEPIPGVTTGSPGEPIPDGTDGSPGEGAPDPDATDGASGGSENPSDEPANGGVTENGISGTPFDDIFLAADHDNFQAIAFIDGREGFDAILGTNSNDVLDFGVPDAPVLISIELIDGGRGNDIIFGARGDDVIQGGKGNDMLFGGLGNDRLDGGDDNDTLNGNDGDDIIDGNDGDDILFGGSGNDTLIGNDGEDVLQGDSGDDTFVVRGRTDGTDNFDGGSGLDMIIGTDNDDMFHVLDRLANINSIEVIDGRDGFDTILGTNGDDVLDFRVPSAPVLIGIERIDGGRGNDTIIGTGGDDVIDGGAGRDVLMGGPGNDRLTGGTGSDIFSFRPGDGNNLITDFSRIDILRLEGFAPADVAGAVWDNFNSILFAGSGSDQISITLQGYSVTDSGLPTVTAFDSSQMTT